MNFVDILLAEADEGVLHHVAGEVGIMEDGGGIADERRFEVHHGLLDELFTSGGHGGGFVGILGVHRGNARVEGDLGEKARRVSDLRNEEGGGLRWTLEGFRILEEFGNAGEHHACAPAVDDAVVEGEEDIGHGGGEEGLHLRAPDGFF